VELAWSSPTDQLLVIQQLLGKPGPYQVSGLKLSPLTVHWNQVLEFGLDHGRLAMAPHPNGGAIVALSWVESSPDRRERSASARPRRTYGSSGVDARTG
jgi:hypothetical protein